MPLMKKTFVNAVQARVARIAISASATRGQQSPGLVLAARDFCTNIDLSRFSTNYRPTFASRLEETTVSLTKKLPRTGRHWGVARKLLNIFLRDALYTSYLREWYGLIASEDFLEVPLDSISSGEIRKLVGRSVLPKWPGVKYLTAAISADYQRVAQEEADRQNIARVHLDTYWWGGSRTK
jgi:hypothetical protein